MPAVYEITYNPIPTLLKFHQDPSQIRCIVGPVGSGKTTAVSMEVGYYLPRFLEKTHGIKHTRGVIVRNTYPELRDTTMRTFMRWCPGGSHAVQKNEYTLRLPGGLTIEILFRSCDRPEQVKQFKSLDITWYWIDESIEVPSEVKKMLKNRIGRWPEKSPVRFGIETTNPPDVEHDTYWEFDWGDTPPPGPLPERSPKKNHRGFWQPPRENERNLRVGYYDDLISDYEGDQDWIDMYVYGKPGVLIKGKLVFYNFRRGYHVADHPLIWNRGELWRGWDNSGNVPACVIVQKVDTMKAQVLREFNHDKMGIVDFGKWVVAQCNEMFPGASFRDWGDPAGENTYSKKTGGFTSNAQLMRSECGINVQPSDQNLTARIQSVDQCLTRYDGLLIDPSCVRLINGFMGGYCYPEIGTTGVYQDKPGKNRFAHVHDALQYVLTKMFANAGGSGFAGRYTPPRRGRGGKRRWGRRG